MTPLELDVVLARLEDKQDLARRREADEIVGGRTRVAHYYTGVADGLEWALELLEAEPAPGEVLDVNAPELAADGGLPFDEEDVIVRRTVIEPGLGDEPEEGDS